MSEGPYTIRDFGPSVRACGIVKPNGIHAFAEAESRSQAALIVDHLNRLHAEMLAWKGRAQRAEAALIRATRRLLQNPDKASDGAVLRRALQVYDAAKEPAR